VADKIPDYAYSPLQRCFGSLHGIHVVLRISLHGFNFVTKRPELTERIIRLNIEGGQEVTAEHKSILERERKDAQFAENEIKNDFPFMHDSALVAAWGSLEAAIEDVAVAILLNEPKAFDKDEFMKVRVPLSTFETLDREDRVRFLIGEVQRPQTAGGAPGVDSFEKLLQLFDLSGNVEEDVKKTLWEMNHMRNIIVHRDSHADSRFVRACPRLTAKVGDRLGVNYSQFARYSDAVVEYVKTLLRRLAVRYGVPSLPWATAEAINPKPSE
jgi:hypothetical protein